MLREESLLNCYNQIYNHFLLHSFYYVRLFYKERDRRQKSKIINPLFHPTMQDTFIQRRRGFNMEIESKGL